MANKIRFYTDEHVAKAVIKGLRERGADVLTVVEAGLLGASDEEHLRMAWAEGRVIFTHDDDFMRLAAAGLQHAGIVYAHQNIPIGELIYGLMLIYQVLDADEMQGSVEYL
jgi:predicted nuclease of predicted toxin-antitoxin system